MVLNRILKLKAHSFQSSDSQLTIEHIKAEPDLRMSVKKVFICWLKVIKNAAF